MLEKDAATHRWHTPVLPCVPGNRRRVSCRRVTQPVCTVHRDSRPTHRAPGAASAARRTVRISGPAAHGGVRGWRSGRLPPCVPPACPGRGGEDYPGRRLRGDAPPEDETRGSPPRFDRAFPRRSRGGSRTRRRRRARAGRLPTRGEAISCPSRVRIRLVLPSREGQGRGDGADAGRGGWVWAPAASWFAPFPRRKPMRSRRRTVYPEDPA